jgi:hypothetical protein
VGQANRARFSVGVRQPETSIALGSRQRRIAVAQACEKRDPGRETAGIWRMSFKGNGLGRRLIKSPNVSAR